MDDERVKEIVDRINPSKKNVEAENLRKSKLITREKLNGLKITKIELQREQDILTNAEKNKQISQIIKDR